MTKKRRTLLAILIILLLLFLLLYWGKKNGYFAGLFALFGHHPAAPVANVSPAPTPTAPIPPTAPKPKPSVPKGMGISPSDLLPSNPPLPLPVQIPVAPLPVPVPPPPVVTPPVIPPGQEGMHRELIPKNIDIVRCYYDEDVVNPGTTFAFSINGSGFDEHFQSMISVDMDALDVDVKNLRLVTANQIQGMIVVGPEATTEYIYPKVVIHGLPVFRAPDPFGVVRYGEVLDIQLTGIDDTGQSGKFQIITNLDDRLMKIFHIDPTTKNLEVGSISPLLPFYINGEITIAPGLRSGSYGLTTRLGPHELFRKDPLVDVVRPDVGRTGSVSRFKAAVLVHRPGDVLDIVLEGSGFVPSDAGFLTATINEFDMGQGSFSYVSPGKLDITYHIPPNAPVGTYGMTLRHKAKVIHEQDVVFGIVPPNWLADVKLTNQINPGQSGFLQIEGRDISFDFVRNLKIETDEPGLQISAPHYQSPSIAVADIHVSTGVAPGDYLLHVSAGSKPLRLPRGSIIKVGS